MKKIFRKTIEKGDSNISVLLLRVGAALMMLTHGFPKLMQLFSDEPIAFMSVMGLSMTISLALAVFAEVICSVLVLIGLGTRLASIPIIITMLTAAFVYHGADPFAGKEMALLYALIFVAILIKGGGKYSADHVLGKKLKQQEKQYRKKNEAVPQMK